MLLSFSFLFLISQTWALPKITWPELYGIKNWEEISKQDSSIGNISVYRGMIEDFPCFLGKAQTQLSADLLLSIASHAEEAIEWSSAGVTEAKELKRTKAYVDYYQYLDVPIFSDRYWILRGHFVEEATNKKGLQTKIFHWDKISNNYPELQKKVQEKNPYALEPLINVGSWIFKPLDEKGTIEVFYYICSHPGGSVPVALQSIATEKTLPDNIKDLLEEGAKRSQ